MRMTRRRWLGLAAGGLALGPGSVAYARFIEPTWLKTVRHSVPLDDAPPSREPVSLLHLSDLHASPVVPYDYLEHMVDRAVALRPDVIAITGDFVTRAISQRDRYVALLTQLSEAAPTFAVPGNHDGGVWVGPRGGYATLREINGLLADAGITVLGNAHRDLEMKGRTIRMVGVGDLWAENCRPDRAFPAGAVHTPTILLCHNPDAKSDLLNHPWDLMLCGHTHGGQLALPLVGTPFAPVRDHRYVHGLHQWAGRWLHVTSGVGNIRGFRLNCRPEIALLRVS